MIMACPSANSLCIHGTPSTVLHSLKMWTSCDGISSSDEIHTVLMSQSLKRMTATPYGRHCRGLDASSCVGFRIASLRSFCQC